MARSISEIKAHICETFLAQDAIRSVYGLSSGQSFDKVFSPVSLESLMFYVVASCIWLLEKLFDRHREEVDARIEALRPHTLRWYASKAKEYMRGKDLIREDGVVVADYYTQVYIKVATRGINGRPRQLEAEDLAGLKGYLAQIKDAGVAVKVLNEPADNMRVELMVLYDPAIFMVQNEGETDDDGYTALSLMQDNKNVIEEAVSRVISELPFNGEYRNSDLLAAVQAIEGIKVADIIKVEAAAGGSEAYSQVIGYRRPYSGYYALQNLTVKGRPYQTIE